MPKKKETPEEKGIDKTINTEDESQGTDDSPDAKDPKPPAPRKHRKKRKENPGTMHVTVENPKKEEIVIPGDYHGKNNVIMRDRAFTVHNSPRIDAMINAKLIDVADDQTEAVVQTRSAEEARAMKEKSKRKNRK